ncbi:uncharacterized protein LOC115448603 [Manduca sexta]|uniref:Uncharacterized protein n=1 Tax=Manduca sexta TaxID=7130 RepID=A0A922CD77_MANSE|nr:uncharacterized protein LOC115448603 [Manduca sexta]KAG6441892.1 hypothetical protein O3G_MSEX002062 [Manduca sexta]
MDDVRELNLKPNKSFYLTETPKISTHSQPVSKSAIHVPMGYDSMTASCSYRNNNFQNSDDEYYKRYEHDEAPVKESSLHNSSSLKDGKVTLTDSELDKIEIQVFSNVSQQLQTDESSVSSLESNIKFFKTTVQEIFDNFYANMRDFELYKKRFHEILAKNREDSLGDMEDFIKDMIHHIMSSDASNESNKSESLTESEVNAKTWSGHGDGSQAIIPRENTSGVKNTDDILRIILMNDGPCVQIKMNDRNHLSEINIKSPNLDAAKNQIASADNLKKLAAKKLLLENYIQQEVNAPDREIPVKVSYAKKNIHLDEDFAPNYSGDSKSFMARLCNYLCKRFRRNSFG